MTTPPSEISVTLPFGQALSRVKAVLFQPFDLAKWFLIGFCAWLAYLGESGSGGSFNSGTWREHSGQNLRLELEHARDYVMNNIGWIAPLAIALFLVTLTLGLVILWISSRGKFMFLHCVALNRAEVSLPWQSFAREANSLFLFRVAVAFLGMLVVLPSVVALVWTVLKMILADSANAVGILVALALVLLLMLLGLIYWVIKRLMNDFVVPIQFLRRSRCLAAWSELRRLLPGNLSNFILYVLFRIVIGLGTGMLVLAVILVTCCIAGCLFAIPYLGTVFLLPILVFERSYSICYFAQLGPDYNVFAAPVPPTLDQPSV